MGRFASIAGLRRSQVVRLYASDAAVPIPAWAGTAVISGVGGGQGGGNEVTAGQRGTGGGGGAFAYGYRMPILGGPTTASVVIGEGGAGAVGGSDAFYGPGGGDTIIVVGSCSLRLVGGGYSSANGGYPILGARDGFTPGQAHPWATSTAVGMGAPSHPLGIGSTGGGGTAINNGFGAGGHSPWGRGGDGVTSVIADTAGADATGYGAGGAGGQGTGKGGDGTPGFIEIIWEED